MAADVTNGSTPGDRDDVLGSIARLEGWLRPSQAEALWEAAAAVPPGGQIVEIGSYRAKSTIVLASAASADTLVVAIDPHAGTDRAPGEWRSGEAEGISDHDHFERNLRSAGVRDRVRHVREFSHDASEAVVGMVDLLYVDGAHGYKPAADDITRWGSRVAHGGRLMIHDVGNSLFVTLAVARHLSLSRRWRYEGRAASLATYRREDHGLGALAGDLWRQKALFARLLQKMAVKALRALRLGRLVRLVGQDPGEGLY